MTHNTLTGKDTGVEGEMTLLLQQKPANYNQYLKIIMVVSVLLHYSETPGDNLIKCGFVKGIS